MKRVSWDESNKHSYFTTRNNGLTTTRKGSSGYVGIRATDGKSSGKWYWEIHVDDSTTDTTMIGVIEESADLKLGHGSSSGNIGTKAKVYWGGGYLLNPDISGVPSYRTGDIIGVLLDLDNYSITFQKNGVDVGKAMGGLDKVGKKWFPFTMSFLDYSVTANFGRNSFKYSIPKGYKSYDKLDKTLILHDGEYKKWNKGIEYTNEFISAIPPLTSETSTIGETFGNGSAGGYFKAFDVTTNTFWQSSTPQIGAIGFRFFIPRKIEKYTLENYTATTRYNPKDWTFEGSNNAVDWVVLHRMTNRPSSNPNITEIEISNNKYFTHYRFNITNINNMNEQTNRPWIHKIKMFERVVTDAVPAQWKTVSNILPTSTQFLSDGMDSLSPLIDRRLETLEPLPMLIKSGILQAGEEGKVFSKTIDLKKYIDIRSMEVEVK